MGCCLGSTTTTLGFVMGYTAGLRVLVKTVGYPYLLTLHPCRVWVYTDLSQLRCQVLTHYAKGHRGLVKA